MSASCLGLGDVLARFADDHAQLAFVVELAVLGESGDGGFIIEAGGREKGEELLDSDYPIAVAEACSRCDPLFVVYWRHASFRIISAGLVRLADLESAGGQRTT